MQHLSHLLRSNTKFKHLHLVVALSERLHIGKVAEDMNLSQPAISKSLADIESIVGAKLFERTQSGLVETPQGKLFVEFAREALSRAVRLAEDLAAAQLGLGSTVQVGSQISGTAVLLPLAVKRLKQLSPHTTVRLDDGLIEPLLERLKLVQLDLVIGRLDLIPDTTGMLVEPLYQDAVVVVAAAGSAVSRRQDLNWPELATFPWILQPPGSSARRRFDEAARQHGMEVPKDVIETGSLFTMLALMRERESLCVLPERLARYCEAASLVTVMPLPSVHLGSPIGIVSLEGRRQRPGVTLFIDCLRLASKADSLVPVST